MRTWLSWLRPVRHLLGPHVERLRDSLENIIDALRDAIARVVGQSVSEATRELVRVVLAALPESPRLPSRSPWARDPPSWQEEERDWADDPDPWGRDDDASDVRHSRTHTPPEVGEPSRWQRALALGCAAAGWWLRRQAGRLSTAVAIVVGMLATVAAYAAGTGLTGSALGLTAVAEIVRSGVTLLSRLHMR